MFFEIMPVIFSIETWTWEHYIFFPFSWIYKRLQIVKYIYLLLASSCMISRGHLLTIFLLNFLIVKINIWNTSNDLSFFKKIFLKSKIFFYWYFLIRNKGFKIKNYHNTKRKFQLKNKNSCLMKNRRIIILTKLYKNL